MTILITKPIELYVDDCYLCVYNDKFGELKFISDTIITFDIRTLHNHCAFIFDNNWKLEVGDCNYDPIEPEGGPYNCISWLITANVHIIKGCTYSYGIYQGYITPPCVSLQDLSVFPTPTPTPIS